MLVISCQNQSFFNVFISYSDNSAGRCVHAPSTDCKWLPQHVKLDCIVFFFIIAVSCWTQWPDKQPPDMSMDWRNVFFSLDIPVHFNDPDD